MEYFIYSILIMLLIGLVITTISVISWNPLPSCHICGGNTDYEWICERCDQFYCDKCSAQNTYLTPIDYNCCEDCANSRYDDIWDD